MASKAAPATATWPAAKVQLWPLSKIKKYARNPKTHTPEQVRELAAMMREFGVTTAMLLDADGEIIAGHGRLEAAELNQYVEYPIMIAEGWTEAQKKAYRLADNVIPTALGAALAPDMVKLELADLGKLNYDTERFGLDDIELPELAPEAAPRSVRTKTTIFVSVKNDVADRTRRVIKDALKKAKIDHNL